MTDAPDDTPEKRGLGLSLGDLDLVLALAPPARERLTLPHFLEDVATRHGPRVALRFDDIELRYEELAEIPQSVSERNSRTAPTSIMARQVKASSWVGAFH